MLLALDDTDGPDGGCTTHLLAGLLPRLDAAGLAPRGPPHLVRLNPNVPYRTRGNGAVAVELVHAEGPGTGIGSWDGRPVMARPHGAPAEADPRVMEAVWLTVQAHAHPGARPAAVLLDSPAPAQAYWSAVRTRVAAADARRTLAACGARMHAVGDGRGLVGCLGALAWPGPASSHELIAYRHPGRIGSPRRVAAEPLAALDAAGTTFHGVDPESGRTACVPATPCPVLAGLRGRDGAPLVEHALPALRRAAEEDVHGWLLWATNQASGDHVTPVERFSDAPEWGTVAAPAAVAAAPRTVRGGHVFVDLEDDAGQPATAAAFEPTKGFRGAVRALRRGDRVTAVGPLEGGTLRLERLRVDALTDVPRVAANPACASCGRSMKSMGRGAGYRCPRCRAKAPAEAALQTREPRTLAMGWHEVPVGARRHLHRPVEPDAGRPPVTWPRSALPCASSAPAPSGRPAPRH